MDINMDIYGFPGSVQERAVFSTLSSAADRYFDFSNGGETW
jgi:hypothetical protein